MIRSDEFFDYCHSAMTSINQQKQLASKAFKSKDREGFVKARLSSLELEKSIAIKHIEFLEDMIKNTPEHNFVLQDYADTLNGVYNALADVNDKISDFIEAEKKYRK